MLAMKSPGMHLCDELFIVTGTINTPGLSN